MQKKPYWLATLALVLAALACTIFVGGPDYPVEPIPVSTEAVLGLQEEIKAALKAGAQAGSVSMAINEEQLTSYLAFRLQSQAEPLFTEPQVYLRDGQMQIYGKARQGYFTANVGIVVTAGVDEQGRPKVEITSADFGPLPVPAGLKETMSTAIEEAYTSSLGPIATGFRLESITIANGLMTVAGRIK